MTLTDRVRTLTGGLLSRVGYALNQMGIHPNTVTLVGLGIIAVAGFLIGSGRLFLAGWVLAFGAILDAVDGAVARARADHNGFGAALDSSLDRYADGFIFASLSYYFANQMQPWNMLLALAALVGSYMVSYVRARADGPDVGVSVTVGLFTRLERLVMVVCVLWFWPWILVPGMWVLAIGTNVTAAHRLWYLRAALKNDEV